MEKSNRKMTLRILHVWVKIVKSGIPGVAIVYHRRERKDRREKILLLK